MELYRRYTVPKMDSTRCLLNYSNCVYKFIGKNGEESLVFFIFLEMFSQYINIFRNVGIHRCINTFIWTYLSLYQREYHPKIRKLFYDDLCFYPQRKDIYYIWIKITIKLTVIILKELSFKVCMIFKI